MAQELPPIFKDTQKQPAPAKNFSVFPEKTFLENIVLQPDGQLLVNSHYEGIVYKIDTNGQHTKFASVNGKVTGIAAYGRDTYILSGVDNEEKAVLYTLQVNGNMSKVVTLPDAIFLNGILQLKGDDFLVADSYKGCIWKVNVATKTISNWLEDDLLKRGNDQNPTPGANGIKLFKNVLYISNTQKQLLISVPVKNGMPQKPAVIINNANIDDFSIDSDGTIYATTHVYNSIIKITPDKNVIIIAGQEQGVAGSTACVLKKNSVTKKSVLYVSTNGGMSFPPPTGIEASKIIAIRLP